MSFKNIVGQKKAVEILLGLLENQKIATSYLFCGEEGIGKKTVAVQFAKALNCLGNGSPSSVMRDEIKDADSLRITDYASRFDACDACDACVKIDGGVHPDFLLVSPEERQIRIEEVRMIEDALSFKPFEGKKKVVVVDGAEMMNLPAANAFLKTLEEPPEESVLILVSSKPDLLPSTISSRCSRINFSPLSMESCKTVLGAEMPGKNLELITRLSMGRPGVAFTADLLDERAWFLDLLNGMLKAEKDGWTSREDMERWFEYALVLMRDMAVLKITGDFSRLINVDLGEYLTGLNKSVDLNVIIYIHKELNRVRAQLMFNLNKSITWNYTASLLRKEMTR
jgi:DNA polymerase-3 subunit delta'